MKHYINNTIEEKIYFSEDINDYLKLGVLTGSRAFGVENPDSDYDICVNTKTANFIISDLEKTSFEIKDNCKIYNGFFKRVIVDNIIESTILVNNKRLTELNNEILIEDNKKDTKIEMTGLFEFISKEINYDIKKYLEDTAIIYIEDNKKKHLSF